MGLARTATSPAHKSGILLSVNNLERLRLERDTMIKRVAAAEAEEAARRAREAFRLLGKPTAPVLEIIDQTLIDHSLLDPQRAARFVDRLQAIARAHTL